MSSAFDPEAVLSFWFSNGPRWFNSNLEFDTEIIHKFKAAHKKLIAIYDIELNRPREFLAAIIVLDQFSRNMFRDTADAFAQDAKAPYLAKFMLFNRYEQECSEKERAFIYLPFMHSEHLEDQQESLRLFKSFADQTFYQYAIKHHSIIQRFGRFPHRNEVLGRTSTEEEMHYLKAKGVSIF